MKHKRKKKKVKTNNGYLTGDGPRGNSKMDQTKQEKILDQKQKEQAGIKHLNDQLVAALWRAGCMLR